MSKITCAAAGSALDIGMSSYLTATAGVVPPQFSRIFPSLISLRSFGTITAEQ